jgi:DNA invertase Pin-like site-specific DNA recombinase
MNKGKIIGYKRVSSSDQNPERQLEGIVLDKVFIDYASGKDTNRPKLQELLNYVREDDTIIVDSMDRFARNLNDLLRLVGELTLKGISIKFIKESLSFNNDISPMSKLLLSVIGAVAEFERSLIKERQMEGIALAKLKGVYKGGNNRLSEEDVAFIKEKHSLGVPKTRIAKMLNICRYTVYKYIKEVPLNT